MFPQCPEAVCSVDQRKMRRPQTPARPLGDGVTDRAEPLHCEDGCLAAPSRWSSRGWRRFRDTVCRLAPATLKRKHPAYAVELPFGLPFKIASERHFVRPRGAYCQLSRAVTDFKDEDGEPVAFFDNRRYRRHGAASARRLMAGQADCTSHFGPPTTGVGPFTMCRPAEISGRDHAFHEAATRPGRREKWLAVTCAETTTTSPFR